MKTALAQGSAPKGTLTHTRPLARPWHSPLLPRAPAGPMGIPVASKKMAAQQSVVDLRLSASFLYARPAPQRHGPHEDSDSIHSRPASQPPCSLTGHRTPCPGTAQHLPTPPERCCQCHQLRLPTVSRTPQCSLASSAVCQQCPVGPARHLVTGTTHHKDTLSGDSLPGRQMPGQDPPEATVRAVAERWRCPSQGGLCGSANSSAPGRGQRRRRREKKQQLDKELPWSHRKQQA